VSASAGGAAERLRLFFGLPVPPSAVAVLVPWQQKVFAGRPGVRAVPGEHLHVTLAFLGSRPRAEVPALREALSATAAGHGPIVLTPTHYRETERVGMLVLDDEGGCAARLQERLAGTLARMGAYRPERRRWLPHLTVARHAARPRLRPPLPELGPFSPSAAALYESVLRRDGAKYRVIEAVTLE
jgi:2'-5' RNA ligase